MKQYESLLKPFVNRFPVLPLTTEELDDFLLSIKGELVTRLNYRTMLVMLYLLLEERKWMPKGLVKVPRVKKERKLRRVLSKEELRNLFKFTENFQEKAILATLIDSGIRAGELCSLDRENVYPDHIRVKGKKRDREAPIKPDTYEMLCLLADKGPLFKVRGKRMDRHYAYATIRRLMERSGLEGKKLGPHILRHSRSVQHIVEGGDIESLKEELGHEKIETTAIYAHLAFPQVKTIHEKVDVLGKIAGDLLVERAICYGCNREVVVEPDKVKRTKCPGCGQVGSWYLPNHRAKEE